MKTTLLALLLATMAACSKHSTPPDPSANGPSTDNAERRSPGSKTFGEHCREDSDCASPGVCFHVRPRPNAEQQQQQPGREGRHGYCSTTCTSDSDCASPPSNGKCAPKKKMCRRERKNGGGPGAQPSQPTPPPSPAGNADLEEEEE